MGWLDTPRSLRGEPALRNSEEAKAIKHTFENGKNRLGVRRQAPQQKGQKSSKSKGCSIKKKKERKEGGNKRELLRKFRKGFGRG